MSSKKMNIVSLLTAIIVLVLVYGVNYCYDYSGESNHAVKIGFIYDGDESTPYTENFLEAQKRIEEKYGDAVECIVRKNVTPEASERQFESLVEEGCGLIFTNSYSYEKTAKEMASKFPNVQFCQAAGDNAGTEPVLKNYHTFMGKIYEGRYAAGVVAGLKLEELIKQGKIKPEEAVVGYVAAYPYSEVISGYTAFILGIRSVVPEATMRVRYTNSWSSYTLEKECARKFIDEGCIIISQHSDTAGPAVACEETEASKIVYFVGYNNNMNKLAPTTYLVSSRINWTPYMVSAVGAVINGYDIESTLKVDKWGNDAAGGFADGWVELLKFNEQAIADGTKEKLSKIIKQLKNNEIDVFYGNYVGINPENPDDRYDLTTAYKENSKQSLPAFNYILEGVVTIEN